MSIDSESTTPCASCGETETPAKEMELMVDQLKRTLMLCTDCALQHISAVLKHCSELLRLKT